MKNVIVRLSIVCFILMMGSCGEGFIYLLPQSSLSVEGFYKTQTDINRAVLGVYANLRGLYNNDIHYLGEIRSDNTTIAWLIGGLPANERQIDEFREPILESNSYVNSHWNTSYNIIMRANTVIENVGQAVFDIEPLRIQYEAEARFIRALTYFKLVKVFGGEGVNGQLLGVCIVNKPILPNEAYEIGRSSLEDTYNFIIADLDFAQRNLPITYLSADRGRITQAGAAALLAKVYMHMAGYPLNKGTSHYNMAITQIENFFRDYPGVSLVPSYKDLFDVTQKNSVESLIEIQYMKGTSGEAASSGWNGLWAPLGSDPYVVPFAPCRGINSPTADMSNAYELGDPRKYVSMRDGYTAANNVWMPSRFVCKYYDTPTTGANFGNNWIELRLADIHLLYAEALVRTGGDKTTALNYLNRIRQRARNTTLTVGFPHSEHPGYPAYVPLPEDGLKDYALSDFANDEEFLLAIEKERRVELAFESHRWFDLIRTGRAKDVMIAEQHAAGWAFEWEDRALMYPIPESVMRSNPGKIIQNKGYVQF